MYCETFKNFFFTKHLRGDCFWYLANRSSYNLTPPISWALVGRYLIFCSLTLSTCFNSPRKLVKYKVKYKARQKARFPRVTGKTFEIISNLTIKTSEQRPIPSESIRKLEVFCKRGRSGVLNQTPFSCVSMVDFEQVNVFWVIHPDSFNNFSFRFTEKFVFFARNIISKYLAAIYYQIITVTVM